MRMRTSSLSLLLLATSAVLVSACTTDERLGADGQPDVAGETDHAGEDTSVDTLDDTGIDSSTDTTVDPIEDSKKETLVDDTGNEAAADTDADADADAPVVIAPSCTTPVDGSTPFSVTLNGTGMADGGVVSGYAEIYFPEGRAAGRPVIMAVPRYFPPATRAIARGVLDSTLSATLTAKDPDCMGGVSGTLVGPADGMDAVVSNNKTAPSDAVDIVSAPAALCPMGTPSAPAFSVGGVTPLPTQTVHVDGNVPLDTSTFSTIFSTPSRPLDVQEDGTRISIKGKNAFDPFTELTVDLSGVRDVLGRPIGALTFKTQALSASLTDGTFATAPSSGAYFGDVSVSAGVLRATAATYPGIPLILVLGIGSQGSKTSVHLQHRFECSFGGLGDARVSLVSESGDVVDVMTDCTTAIVDKVVTIPASRGRWAVVAVRHAYESRPCWGATGGGPTAYLLDAVAFE